MSKQIQIVFSDADLVMLRWLASERGMTEEELVAGVVANYLANLHRQFVQAMIEKACAMMARLDV